MTPSGKNHNSNRKMIRLVSSNDVINNSYDNQFYSSIKLAKQVRDMQAQKSQLQTKHHQHQDLPKLENSTSHFEANNRELTANRTPLENSRKSEMLNAKIMS